MRWSVRLGSVRGIEIRVHLLSFVVLAMVVLAWSGPSAGRMVLSLAFTVSLFGCVLLHEIGHGVVAEAHGIRVRDILLLPVGGVARLEAFPEEPWTELKIALAGPAVNLAIFLLLGPFVVVLGPPDFLTLAGRSGPIGPVASVIGLLWAANLAIGVFNLLPAFPLDGGKALRALLALRSDPLEATERTAVVGRCAAVGLLVFGFVIGEGLPWFLALAIFIFIGGWAEVRRVRLRHLPRRVVIEDGMEVIPPDAPEAIPPTLRRGFDFG